MANNDIPTHVVSEMNFPVMILCGKIYKPLIISYGISFHGDIGLQAGIRSLFDLHSIPTLRVIWAYNAILENPWPATTPLVEDNTGPILRLLAARGSQDIIEAVKPEFDEHIIGGIVDEMEESL